MSGGSALDPLFVHEDQTPLRLQLLHMFSPITDHKLINFLDDSLMLFPRPLRI